MRRSLFDIKYECDDAFYECKMPFMKVLMKDVNMANMLKPFKRIMLPSQNMNTIMAFLCKMILPYYHSFPPPFGAYTIFYIY